MLARVKRMVAALLRRAPGGIRLLAILRQVRRAGKIGVRSLLILCRTGRRSEVDLFLGNTLYQEGQSDRAVERFTHAIHRSPDCANGYLARGLALREAGRIADACRDFRAGLGARIRTADEAATLHENLASVLAELHDIDQAVRHAHARLLIHREKPGEGEWVQTLIEAHDALAEDAINRRGDFATALEIYRRKGRVQQHYAETFGHADNPVLYLPADWVRNIGHMALLDFWVKMHRLGWRSWEKRVLLAPRENTANATYLRYWEEYFTVVSDPDGVRELSPLASSLGSRVAGLLEVPGRPAAYFCDGVGIIQEEWEAQGRPPLLRLTDEDREHGVQVLERMGVPRGSWFVSLHVRSPGFHQEAHEPDQAHRNADIRSYLPAIREITARGGWVVRMGDRTMEPLPPLPGVLDYARSAWKSDRMDVFLCAACRFFIGVASGLSHVPGTFGVPCGLTNWVSSPLPFYGVRDRFIPKLLWSEGERRFLRFAEMLEPPVAKLSYCGRRMRERGLRAVNNTVDEILDLVGELFEVLEERVIYTARDEERQQAFRAVARGSGCDGFPRVGRSFLTRHADLLHPRDAADVPFHPALASVGNPD